MKKAGIDESVASKIVVMLSILPKISPLLHFVALPRIMHGYGCRGDVTSVATGLIVFAVVAIGRAPHARMTRP